MQPSSQSLGERELSAIERSTQEIGRRIFEQTRHAGPTIVQRRWWDDRIMAWAMADESVKLQMFRFVDVLPMLGDHASISRHLHEYFHDVAQFLPSAVRLGLQWAEPNTIAGRAVAMAARRNALSSARRFIAGTNSQEVLAAARRERKLRRAFTLDLLGEAVTSEPEADRYLHMYLELIRQLAPAVNRWPEVPQIDRSELAPLPRVNVSVKLSALDSQFDSLDWDGTTERVATRLRMLFREARAHHAYIHVDMENYDKKDLTLHIFRSVLREAEFRDWADVGIVIQCYLRDAEADLVALRDWAVERGTSVWVRLVKGAYWDYETVLARQRGWDVPVYEQKWRSDANYERLTRFLLGNHPRLRTALASHNIRSLAHGMATARHLGVPQSAFELQMLYGMADEEKQAIVDLGHRLRIYMPYGELIPGMAYLVRRLLENTSNDSFLRASFSAHVDLDRLLSAPQAPSDALEGVAPAVVPCRVEEEPIVQSIFINEPHTDFGRAENRLRMQQALTSIGAAQGRHEPLVINGQRIDTPERLTSYNPSHRRRIVGTTASATQVHVDAAVAAAALAYPAWNATPVERRAQLLMRLAELMSQQRMELSAWMVYECGKTWREADADTAEAIDFCRYYAQQAVDLQAGHLNVSGEENRFVYLGRGVAAVIAPWNFPLAILTGMTVAALVTGNTVIMKPAEQSALLAARLMELCEQAGFPSGVIHYLSGRGELAGAALVEHPQVALIAFTGSRQVGLAIHRRAAELSASGIPLVKRVIAEMGGKNAIIVDDDADLDEAVVGVMKSAFGYQGQKCSACSRAIVLDAVHDVFVQRLIDATQSLKIGPAEDPATSVGPVIDAAAFQTIHTYIEHGFREARNVLSLDPGSLVDEGYYIGPHIFTDVPSHAKIAQEEIFGPVLAVLRAADFDQALQRANDTPYALTGGVFSRSPAHLEQARREFQVGNLYLNRGITGAMVARQPFGGYRLSGIGSKAGGADYLLQFVVPKTVTENTLRRGFAPPAE